MKKNELAVTGNKVVAKVETKVVANAKKENKILSLTETTETLQKAVVGSKCKVYTDSKFYVGVGTKCNAFSVNVKKTKYNVYCNSANLDIVSKLKLEGCTITKNGNSADHTRPHSIECKNTESLLAMIKAVIDSEKVAVAK